MELPDVEIANKTSLLQPIPSNARENTFSNPKSLPHAVKNVLSNVNEIEGIDCLFNFGFNLTKNSVARCWASDAEPPFPQNRIFPLFFVF